MRIFSIVILTVLAGCATPGPWTKPGDDGTHFEQDKYTCLIDSKDGVGGYDDRLFNACMGAKGYLR